MPSVFPLLEDILNKLELPTRDLQRDTNLQLILDGVTEAVTEVTGYSDNSTAQTVTLQNVYTGRNLLLPYRPVASITSVKGREVGSTTETDISYDLIDPAKGVFQIIPSAFGWPWGFSSASIRWKSRRVCWPVVTIVYTPTPTLPVKLFNAVLDACVYRYHRSGAGATRTQSRGPLMDVLMELDLPLWVTASIRRERREGAVLWV